MVDIILQSIRQSIKESVTFDFCLSSYFIQFLPLLSLNSELPHSSPPKCSPGENFFFLCNTARLRSHHSPVPKPPVGVIVDSTEPHYLFSTLWPQHLSTRAQSGMIISQGDKKLVGNGGVRRLNPQHQREACQGWHRESQEELPYPAPSPSSIVLVLFRPLDQPASTILIIPSLPTYISSISFFAFHFPV